MSRFDLWYKFIHDLSFEVSWGLLSREQNQFFHLHHPPCLEPETIEKKLYLIINFKMNHFCGVWELPDSENITGIFSTNISILSFGFQAPRVSRFCVMINGKAVSLSLSLPLVEKKRLHGGRGQRREFYLSIYLSIHLYLSIWLCISLMNVFSKTHFSSMIGVGGGGNMVDYYYYYYYYILNCYYYYNYY